MSDFKPIRKAMVVIAVSNYDPPYEALPGTITSARRIADWAKAPVDGRNYKVVEITDAPVAGRPGQAVTVERLRTEMTDLLDNNIVDRLVVYFAGHGVVRSTAEEFWLLSHAGQDSNECVGVMAFTNGLKNYGIGVHNPDLTKGQLVVIADACRTVHSDGLAFVSNAVMTRKGKAVALQTDMFRATTLGAYAFQVKAVDGAEPYCLFSSVLCDALEGKVPEVIEERYHPFSPVISNDKLADYLDKEVPRRAEQLKEIMEPDSLAGIRLSHNYYDILRPQVALPVEVSRDDPFYSASTELPSPIVIGIPKQIDVDGANIDAMNLESLPLDRETMERFEKAARDLWRTAGGGQSDSVDAVGASGAGAEPHKNASANMQVGRIEIIVGRAAGAAEPSPKSSRVPRMQFEPEPDATAGLRRSLARADLLIELARKDAKLRSGPRVLFDGGGRVAIPNAAAAAISQVEFGWAYAPPSRLEDLPIFVRSESGWTLAPSLNQTITVILEELPGDVLLRIARAKDWDLSLSSGARLIPGMTPRASEAKTLAGRIRNGEAWGPNDAVRAGYLFGLAGDNDSIDRLAHEMCSHGLPVDLAVLAAKTLEWRAGEGRWQLLADLQDVEADEDTQAPALPARSSVAVTGLLPMHRQGWQLLLDPDRRDVPDLLRTIAEGLVAAAAVVLSDAALEKLAEHFGYFIFEPPKT